MAAKRKRKKGAQNPLMLDHKWFADVTLAAKDNDGSRTVTVQGTHRALSIDIVLAGLREQYDVEGKSFLVHTKIIQTQLNGTTRERHTIHDENMEKKLQPADNVGNKAADPRAPISSPPAEVNPADEWFWVGDTPGMKQIPAVNYFTEPNNIEKYDYSFNK